MALVYQLSALKLLDAAKKEESLSKADRIKALKHMAFSLCLTGKTIPCRNEFQKIFEMDAQFELTPAEAGHPSWAKTYATAKQRAKDARDKATKDAAKDAAKKK